jgi:hypothetical protein
MFETHLECLHSPRRLHNSQTTLIHSITSQPCNELVIKTCPSMRPQRESNLHREKLTKNYFLTHLLQSINNSVEYTSFYLNIIANRLSESSSIFYFMLIIARKIFFINELRMKALKSLINVYTTHYR